MCAELRYMLELLAPVYSKAKEYKKALQHIVKCQSLLGDLQVCAPNRGRTRSRHDFGFFGGCWRSGL